MMSKASDSASSTSSHALSSASSFGATSAAAAGAASPAEKAPPSLQPSPARSPPSQVRSASAVATKQFDRSLFRAFLAAASRLFCDDDQIVVVDFLAFHEKAYTERDLIERLGWPDRRVREACAALERMQLVAKEQLSGLGGATGGARNADRGGSSAQSAVGAATGRASDSVVGSSSSSTVSSSGGRGAGGGVAASPPPAQVALSASPLGASASQSAPFYFRISPYCLLVFHFRLQRVEQQVEDQRRAAENRDLFYCPRCRAEYDAVDAQLLDVHPHDAHFLCKFCSEKLEHEDSKVVLQQAVSLQQRCEKQLQTIRTLVRRGWNMEIPTFPPFSRAERTAYRKRPAEEGGKAPAGGPGSATGSLPGAGPASTVGSALGADDSLSDTSLPGGGVRLQMRQGLASAPEAGGASWRQTPAWVLPEHQAEAAGASSAGGGSVALARAAAAAAAAGARAASGVSTHGGAPAPDAQHSASARAPQQQRQQGGGGGGRHQIRFSMKGSASSTGGKSAPSSVVGSKARSLPLNRTGPGGRGPPGATAAGLQTDPRAAAGGVSPGATPPSATKTAPRGNGSTAASSADLSDVSAAGADGPPAGRPKAVVAASQDELRGNPQRGADVGGVSSQASGDGELSSPSAFASSSAGAAAGAAVSARDTSTNGEADPLGSVGAGGSAVPLFYVGKLGREMTLEEAADHQLDMTAEEHERFMELQAVYLDDI
ncbi:general transcription factor IIE polypeptide 1 GTF2E1 [Besnoitia besnoiti]|uniref:General transcription factor IIE polypeptide 1 GTF2E1 n=1 Tax=Besnoitia besnoiti TaxID=94643 RepID=A0A2A9MMS5_BESBE|nr:general transcription factor IIE polypeptide 1 GTF2E1 [Besnoitia besnoiti]PFH38684.1 general transcription factor IIE polypeptide 1 GTF2E1 [Besnoitia besnoiti]